MNGRLGYLIVTVAAMLVALVALSACGGDDDDGDSGDSANQSEAAGASAEEGLATAQERLDEYYSLETFKQPPSEAPAPESGKNVWSITLGLAQDASADFDSGFSEASESMGWDVTSCDGEFSPNKWSQCIRQAISDQADGVALYVIDCPSVQAPLREAREAGITVVATESPDCSDVEQGGPTLFDAKVEFTQGDFAEWLAAQAESEADASIVQTDGDAKVILLWETDAWALNHMHEARVAEYEELCPNCEVVDTIEFVASDLEGPLRQKLEQSLLQNPDANVVNTQYDDPALTVAPAIRQAEASGRELFVTGGVGGEAAVDLIREDRGLDADFVYDIEWEGFHAADTMNRLFNDEEPVPSGVGIGMIDRERDLPPEGEGWTTDLDFKSAYYDAWGVNGG